LPAIKREGRGMNETTKTILFVDDESFIRQSFVDYFEDRFWQTLQAESGEQALEILKTESPDAAIVDIRMDGMDGNDFIRKAYPDNHNTAFVVCTGSPEYEVPADLKILPCVSKQIFKKPITDMAILEKVLLQIIDTRN
jgi:CheY-like chemotaxis protein